MMQGTKSRGSVINWRDGVGREVGGEYRREGTHVCLWPIHIDVWQKPSQYCKVLALQLKQMKTLKTYQIGEFLYSNFNTEHGRKSNILAYYTLLFQEI